MRSLSESRLRELETAIVREGGVALRFERACLLAELGRTEEARNAYLEILSADPAHLLALNNLGTLLYESGYRTAAHTAYSHAVRHHPDDPMSHVNLANALRESGRPEQAREHYEAALRLEPDYPEAHQGLAGVLVDAGDEVAAARHRQIGFGSRPVITLAYRGEQEPVQLLLLVGSAGGNIPVRHFLDDRVFQTCVVYAEYFDPATELPPHRVVFNAIGDADRAAPALVAARTLLEKTDAPVINTPAAVAATGRAENAVRLSRIPGLVCPDAVTLPRGMLRGDWLRFPLLIRTPGFHGGRHFLKVEAVSDLPEALAQLPGDHLTVLQYLDARGPDGRFRKYRVMAIDGALYPLHLAVSSHWKIHYFSADMADSAEHRAEDARFLENMESMLGPRALAALAEVQLRLGLEYAGIDFGLNAAGEVLFFEANATMVVNPPDSDEKWNYRGPAVARIHAAVRNMLLRRAGGRR